MKKSTLLAAAALMLCGTFAQAAEEQSVVFYEENFFEMATEHDRLTDGWIARGFDGKPSDDNLMMLFGSVLDANPQNPVFGEPYFPDVLVQDKGTSTPLLNTCYQDNPSTIDQWMISPEIEVPFDYSQLAFDFINYATSAWVNNAAATGFEIPFKIMVSEGGTDAADFKEILAKQNTGRFATSEQALYATGYTCALNGYKGKKVRLALVVTQPMVGLVGWTNIKIGQYAIQYSNTTDEVGLPGDVLGARFNLGIHTPTTCPGINTVFECNGEKIEKYYKKNFNPSSSAYAFQLINIADCITMQEGESSDYSLTVTPVMTDADGNEIEAIPTVIKGSVKCIQKTFPNTVVMEELTASGCGWCPRGMGAVEYYKDLMKQHREELGVTDPRKGPKFIPMMVHSNMNYSDPMNNGVQLYVSSLNGICGTGLPNSAFNREINGTDPSTVTSFTKMRDTQAIYEARINHVTTPSGEKKVFIDDNLKVSFSVYSGFSAATTNLSAAVVLLENDVQGYESGYIQENYLYLQGLGGVSDIPTSYFSKFLPGGVWGKTNIPASEMVYQEVARGIWPQYSGEPLDPGFEYGVPRTFELEFTVPENIVNLDWDDDSLEAEKFDVVVLIIDNATGYIEAADILDLKSALDYMGVEGVAAESAISVARDGRVLNVNAPAEVNVRLYAADGTLLGNYAEADGNLAVEVEATGIVIVRAECNGETVTRKLIF